MTITAKTVEEYLRGLPQERRAAISAVREVILANLPDGYEEGLQYGMIGYYIPHSIYPAGYHCDPKQPVPFAALAAQKNYMSLYLYNVYSDLKTAQWFTDAFAKHKKKLDMGKSCVRFKKLEDLPLKVIGQAIARTPVREYLAIYEGIRAAARNRAKK